MTISSRASGRLLVPRKRQPARFFEPLEGRVLLHAAIYHILPADLHKYVQDDGHLKASDFLKARPQFVGKDLWSAATFNPNNSFQPKDWLYDPHWLEDDRPMARSPGFPNGTAGGGEAAVLPDLVPLTGGGFLSPSVNQTEIPGHTLLRFTTGVGNQGSGPAILQSANSGTPPAGSGITQWINPDGTQNVLQRLYDFNGSFTQTGYRPAGQMIWHTGHGHFHLEGYARYRLLTNVGGQPGPVAIRSGFDGTEAVGDKVGFCLVNINSNFTTTGGGNSNQLPGYGASGQPSTSCGFLQGIHVGWADVYDSQYDGQWIDVTGVPTGNYFLEVTLDALNVIQETNENNNTVLVPYTLNVSPPPGGIQPDRFEQNNSFAQATNLGEVGVRTESGLTIHITNENDFFRFTAASTVSGNVQLVIANRDVNLYLYDASEDLLGSSTASSNGTSQNPVTKTVNWNFVAGQTYYIRAQGFGSDLNPTTSGISSNYAVKVNINPTVNVSTPTPLAGELGPVSGHIVVARNGPVSSPLTVNFTATGGATRGVDYNIYQDGFLIAGNSFTIGNEASNADLEIRPIADGNLEAAETVTLTLGSGAYVLGGTTSGQVTIHDTPPQVSQTVQTWQTSPHKLAFTFTLDVGASFGPEDVVIMNTDTSTPVAPASIVYGPGNLATVTFTGVLPDGHYQATLSGSGITHALGEPMGADYVYNFFVMTADANHDAVVNVNDFTILAANFGQSPRDASQGDFNYDGIVNINDFTILASGFNTSLAPPSAAGARGRAGGAVTTGPSALRSLFADGKGIDETQQRLIDLLA